MKLKNLPGIQQNILDELQAEEDEYQSWLNGEGDVPEWLEMPIKDPEKLEAICKLVEASVEEGVIFEGNTIVEILPF